MSLTPDERAKLEDEAERLRHEFWNTAGTGPECLEKKRALRGRYLAINQRLTAAAIDNPVQTSPPVPTKRRRTSRVFWEALVLTLAVGITFVIARKTLPENLEAIQLGESFASTSVARAGEPSLDAVIYTGSAKSRSSNRRLPENGVWDKPSTQQIADPKTHGQDRESFVFNGPEFSEDMNVGTLGDDEDFMNWYDYYTLKGKVTELEEEVKSLRETSDLTVAYIIGALQDENRRLREKIVSATTASAGKPTYKESVNVGPGDRPTPFHEVDSPDAGISSEAKDGNQEYRVIEKWGRSPEQVSDLQADVPSLLGMVCVVSPNLTSEELSSLGCQLRREFDTYDNIVVDVFDSESTAKAFAKHETAPSTHHVLSIFKDGNSGQDYVLLHEPDRSIEISCSN